LLSPVLDDYEAGQVFFKNAAWAAEPSGSMDCQRTIDESSVPAYRVIRIAASP
jgi:hypothetical protein